MEQPDAEKSCPSSEDGGLTRNRVRILYLRFYAKINLAKLKERSDPP